MLRVNDLERKLRSGLSVDRRGVLKLLAAAGMAGAAAPVLSACTSGSASSPRSQQTLRVGLIVPQSGALRLAGDEMRTGFEQYLALNGGTIGGMNVALNVIDEGPSVASGTSAVKSAVSSAQYDVLVGVANSQVITQVRDAVTSARVPLIGTNGSPTSLIFSPYVWRTSFVNGEASRAAADYFANLPTSGFTNSKTNGVQNRPRRVMVCDDGTADGQAEAITFQKAYQTPNVQINTMHLGTDSLTNHLTEITNWNPDLIYAACSGQRAVDFVQAYATSGLNVPLYGPGSLTDGWVLLFQKSTARNVFTAMNYAADINNTVNQDFTSAYWTAAGKVPSTCAMATFDAGTVLSTAIAQIEGQVTSAAIVAAFEQAGQFDSPRGRWQFNQNNSPQQEWFLRQVRPSGRGMQNVVLQPLENLT